MDSTRAPENLLAVRSRIKQATLAAGRPAESVRLIAISKRFGVADIRSAFLAGTQEFGESYINESLTKIPELEELDIRWHFVGPVQSNKLKPIARHFDWLHSLCSASHARKLDRHRGEYGLPPLNVCLQLNLSGESTKSGIHKAEVFELSTTVSELKHLRLRGLMTLPARAGTVDEQRVPFHELATIQRELQSRGHTLDTLSMGMSSDLEAAILEGATMVRVGTDVFGKRPG